MNEEGWPEVLAIRVVMMPRDTNAHGTIFGGHILSLIDQAGAIPCHAIGAGTVVTVSMREVIFQGPVWVGDLLSCYARVVKVGRTSIAATVRVMAQSPTAPGLHGPARAVTTAEVVYVQVDDGFAPTPIIVCEPDG